MIDRRAFLKYPAPASSASPAASAVAEFSPPTLRDAVKSGNAAKLMKVPAERT